MKKILALAILTLCIVFGANAQQDLIIPYLHGLRAKGALLLNVRGYEIIADKATGTLSKPFFSKMFPGFNLHQNDKAVLDSSLGISAYHTGRQSDGDSELHYSECYFIQKNSGTIIGISITGAKKPEKSFEQALVKLVLEEGIPDSLISVINPPVRLQFVGRTIPVDNACRWMGSNTMQCHGFGEINWSMHPDMAEAQAQTTLQEESNKRNKQFEIEKQEELQVLLEGTIVTARKIQYRSKGIGGLLAKREGSRTLIVYYVTALVRNRYVSCVLSHWTSDYLEENGLPPLLGTVMQLKY